MLWKTYEIGRTFVDIVVCRLIRSLVLRLIYSSSLLSYTGHKVIVVGHFNV